jgi:secreted PhoX family phosphatase
MKRNSLISIIAASTVVVMGGSTTVANAADKPIYVLSSSTASSVKEIATAGDQLGNWIVPGTPDGMGAYKNSNGTITILSNHEWALYDSIPQSLARADGTYGSSISKLIYDPKTGKVISGSNLIKDISYYNYTTGKWQDDYKGTAPATAPADGNFTYSPTSISRIFANGLNRFCSSYLAPAGSLKSGSLGYDGAVYLTGEEGSGDWSRSFAFDMDGHGIQLPAMGLLQFENLLVAPDTGKNTVVMMNEDFGATTSQGYMYLGTKTSKGTFADKAGLTNGNLYTISVANATSDNVFRSTYGKNKKADVKFMQINSDPKFGATTAAAQLVGTTFSRIEDGEFDPNNHNIYYFITTESNKYPSSTTPNPTTPTVSRDGGALWKMTFKDVSNPLLGATVEMLLDGSEAPYLSKPDNLAVDEDGYLLMQEDPGANDQVSRVIAYRLSDGAIREVAAFDPQYFAATGANLITTDEETSGVINVNKLLQKSKSDPNSYFFFDAQVHTTGGATKARPDLTPADLTAFNNATYEGGQYYLLTVDFKKLFA